MIKRIKPEEIEKYSEDLNLNENELKVIRKYFERENREATDVELYTFSQLWSEHCYHKTFKGSYKVENRFIKNLIKDTIFRVAEELKYDWLYCIFEDNAGIIDFEGNYAIAIKVETHNHPSAIEPFGGAATGIGGVIRDILGVFAEPIACLNVLCFGNLDYPYEKLPKGIKHPRFIFTYVTEGIAYYGNNFGIPNVCGAILFDEGYVGNPVVYCGCVGILNKKKYKRNVREGDLILVIGGRTGRDGIKGASFASQILTEESEEKYYTAVQIGDPIEEEKIKRAVLKIAEEELASGITDLGGGGLCVAVCEQAYRYKLGAEVHLDKLKTKVENMLPWELWISESQERMLLAIPEKNLDRVLKILEDEDVEASIVGRFIKEKRIKVYYKNEIVANLDLEFLFKGIPKIYKEVKGYKKEFYEPDFDEKENYNEDLLEVISHPNVCSKEYIIRNYDHEVKAQTVIKPIGYNSVPNDASVIKPLEDSYKGIVLSVGINLYGKISTYWSAASAIDEAIRNNLAVGGRRIALLDNFTWGSPEKEENLYDLIKACEACYEFAKIYGTPFISGKDSLYNESPLGSVNPTLLITAVGIIPDIRKAVTADLKRIGSSIYILGFTRKELGGSIYYKIKGFVGNSVPKVYPEISLPIYERLPKAIDEGIILSCHDISDGGLAACLAEMTLSNIGCEIYLEKIPRENDMKIYQILFSESNSRFIVEVKDEKRFEEIFNGCIYAKIGRTISDKVLKIYYKDKEVINLPIEEIREKYFPLW